MSIRFSASTEGITTPLRGVGVEVDKVRAKTEKLSWTTSQAMDAFNRSGATITPYRAKLLAAAEAQKNMESGLKSLKDNMETLKGAGKVAAIGMIAQAFGTLGKSIQDVSEMAANGAGIGEISEKLVTGLPVIGNVYEGFKGIGMAISGAGADLVKFKAEGETLDKQIAAANALKKALEDIGTETRTLRFNYAKDVAMGAAGGAGEKAALAAKFAYTDETQKAKDEKKAKLKAAQDTFGSVRWSPAVASKYNKVAAAIEAQFKERMAVAQSNLETGLMNAANTDQSGWSDSMQKMAAEQAKLKVILAGTVPELADQVVAIDKMTSVTDEEKQKMKQSLQTQYEVTKALEDQVKAKTEVVKLDQKQTTASAKDAVVKAPKAEDKKPVDYRGAFVRSGSAEAMMIADASFRSSIQRGGKSDAASKQVELAKTANTLLQRIETALGKFNIPQIVNL